MTNAKGDPADDVHELWDANDVARYLKRAGPGSTSESNLACCPACAWVACSASTRTRCAPGRTRRARGGWEAGS
jgi:hypothetical protein